MFSSARAALCVELEDGSQWIVGDLYPLVDKQEKEKQEPSKKSPEFGTDVLTRSKLVSFHNSGIGGDVSSLKKMIRILNYSLTNMEMSLAMKSYKKLRF